MLSPVKLLEETLGKVNGAQTEHSLKLLILWSGRPGSNRRHSAWESVYDVYYQ
jgi:hypothetical protein